MKRVKKQLRQEIEGIHTVGELRAILETMPSDYVVHTFEVWLVISTPPKHPEQYGEERATIRFTQV